MKTTKDQKGKKKKNAFSSWHEMRILAPLEVRSRAALYDWNSSLSYEDNSRRMKWIETTVDDNNKLEK